MNKEKKEGLLFKTLDRINFWISNVDSKTSFLLSLAGVALGFIFTSSSIDMTVKNSLKTIGTDIKQYISIINILLLMLSIFFIGKAIINFFNALKGRIDPKIYQQKDLETNSLLFWGTISKRGNFSNFTNDLSNVSDENMLNDLQSQVYINSLITTKKFEEYNKGLKSLLKGIVLLIVFKIFSYIPF